MTTLQPLFVRMWASTKWPRYALTTALAILPWLLLLISAPYGFDLTDESFYLLSYAHPKDITATFSMFHFVGKPLYDLSGGDIATMRVLGIVLWLVIATATAWTTLGFVARRCGIEPFGRWERAWLALVPVAGGTIYYRLWLVTPSYNLFALMGLSLFWMGFLWWVEPLHADRQAWRRYVGAGVFGFAAAIVFWSKATSAAVLPVFPLAALLIERRRWRELLSPPTLVWGGVGFAASFGLPVFYGLSISEVVETLQRGVEYQRLMKPAEYGSLKITLVATLKRVYYALSHFIKHRHYPFGDLFFVWLIPPVAAVIAARWLRNGVWWAIGGLMAGWLLNLAVVTWEFRVDLGNWVVNLACVSILFLWAGCFVQHNRPLCIARFGVVWALPVFVLGGAFVFGTNNPYLVKFGEGSYFSLLAIAVLLLVLREKPVAAAMRRVALPAILLAIIYITYVSSLTPYRQSEPVWAMDDHLSIRGGTQTVIVDEEMARYVGRIQLMAAIGGFEPNTPFIDMTGRPGASYVLGGRPYGFPWLLGGYPGSNPAAVYILQQWEPRHLEDAWILTVAENGGRPLSLSILGKVGVAFPDGYTPIGALPYPSSSDQFVAVERNRGATELHTLWKPKP